MAATTPDFYTKQLNSIIEVYQLQQLILEPTQVTDKSKTLIDIILTNNPARLTFSGVCHIGISDHSLVFGIRKISGNTMNKHKYVTSRSLKKFQPDDFINDLKRMPWHNLTVKTEADPNVIWSEWKTMFNSVADKHAPLKKKCVRHRNSPWITSDVKKLITSRINAKKLAVKTGLKSDWDQFRRKRNQVNIAIRKAKTDHYTSQIEDNKGNPRIIWKTINQLMGKNVKNSSISEIKTDTSKTQDPQDIVEILNEHFTTVGVLNWLLI